MAAKSEVGYFTISVGKVEKDWQGKPVSPYDIKTSRRGGARVPLLKTRLRWDKDTFETRWPQSWFFKTHRDVVDYQVFKTCLCYDKDVSETSWHQDLSRRSGLSSIQDLRYDKDTFKTSWSQDLSRHSGYHVFKTSLRYIRDELASRYVENYQVFKTYLRCDKDTFETSWPQD